MEYVESVSDDNIYGNGVVKQNGLVIFVKGSIKGEKIKFSLIKNEKRFSFGKLIRVIKKSENREKPVCKYYDMCGGCHLMHINKVYEEKVKYNYIKDYFSNYCVKDIIPFSNSYRNKITLHVKDNILGFYREETNEIIDIDKCMLVSDKINKVISTIKKLDLKEVKEIIIRESYTTGEVLVKFDGDVCYKDLCNIVHSIYINNKKVYGKDYITEVIDNITYTIYPDSFFQVNTVMMKKLYDLVKLYAGCGNRLLDLYCGTGTIGIYLKDNYKDILGIELNKKAILNANINKEINNIKNISFKCMDCKDIKEDYYDTVVVDPPRSGMNKKTIKFLNDMKSKKLIYVSCNPTTLKRDIKLLDSYSVCEITPVNIFYRTSHIESVCLLESKF